MVDWPGWRKDHGVWVAGDEFDWAVNQVVVEFDAGAVVDVLVAYPDPTDDCIPTPMGGVDGNAIDPTPTPNGLGGAAIDPPETSTLDLVPAASDGRQGILIMLFAATLAAAMFGISRLRTVQVPERSVHIETAEEFTSRVARMRRTRPARGSSARARCRARQA